ncbi:MAG: glycosyltransferase family 4 protein [Verrucomicrobiota bacterium]
MSGPPTGDRPTRVRSVRVSHVITRLIVGGAQENTLASVLGLGRIPDWEVELISGPTRGAEGSLESLALAVPGLLHLEPSLIRPVHPFLDVLAYLRLRAHFRRTRPRIVHTHSGKAGILGRFAARHAGVPWVVHTIHGPSFGEFQGILSNAVFKGAERAAARVTDHFVVVAEAMARQYLQAGIGLPSQYTRIFSGFDLEPFLGARRDPQLAERLGIRPGDFVVGKVARLFRLKGHDALFAEAADIVRQVPNLRFLLLGDGPWRARFEAMAAANPALNGRFIFVGLVPPSEVWRYLGLMDVLVHLSRREGLARVLPQALAAGKPVIALDCDGAAEVCRDGETGFLLRGDASALADCLGLLADSPDLARAMGERGRAWVRERFSEATMVQAIDALYRSLLAREGGGSR